MSLFQNLGTAVKACDTYEEIAKQIKSADAAYRKKIYDTSSHEEPIQDTNEDAVTTSTALLSDIANNYMYRTQVCMGYFLPYTRLFYYK